MSYRHQSFINDAIAQMIDNNQPVIYLKRLEALMHLTVPYKSNLKILGPLALPEHLVSIEPNSIVAFDKKNNFVILKGTVMNNHIPFEEAKIKWQIYGELNFYPDKPQYHQIDLILKDKVNTSAPATG